MRIRKIISFLLVAMMVLGLAGIEAFADEKPSISITPLDKMPVFENGTNYSNVKIATLNLNKIDLETLRSYSSATKLEYNEINGITPSISTDGSELYVSISDKVAAGTYYVVVVGNNDVDGKKVTESIPIKVYYSLDTTSNEVTVDQKYDVEVKEIKSDVTKVQVSWTLNTINAAVSLNQIWDTEKLEWVEDSNNKNTVSVDPVTAEFNYTNYSSKALDAKVSFTAASSFNPTVKYIDKSATTNDGIVYLGTAANDQDTTGTASVEITPNESDFATFTKDEAGTYGTYTITIKDTSNRIWYNYDKTKTVAIDVTSITFTNTKPEVSENIVSWDAPLNVTGYFDKTSKALTYYINGDSVITDNETLFKFHKRTKNDLQESEQLATFNYFLEDDKQNTVNSIEEMKAHEYYEYIDDIIIQYGCFIEAKTITGLDLLDVSNVTDFSFVFFGLAVSELDISSWDVSNATTMDSMFNGSKNLTSLDLSSWNTKNVTKMNGLFECCFKLSSVKVNTWDTSSVTEMRALFSDCNFAEIDISSWDTSNVKDMTYMFAGDNLLTVIYVGEAWSTNSVADSSSMFTGCFKLRNYTSDKTNGSMANTSDSGYLTLKE